jgi:D-glycero-beta-D-manno-heptose 1-phosphate adenylyltransferase
MGTKVAVSQGIFTDNSNFEERFVPSFQRLGEMSKMLKGLGLKIVLTSGSFDLIHMGHALYLEEAKKYGSFLIVGVDSDEKIRFRKGPDRPIVPEAERLQMLSHLRPVDLVTIKPLKGKKWALIEAVKPDVLVATRETYTRKQITELEAGPCGKVVVLDRMATTTTTARLRLLNINLRDKLVDRLSQQLPDLITSLIHDETEGQPPVA